MTFKKIILEKTNEINVLNRIGSRRVVGKWLYSLFRLFFLVSVSYIVIYPLIYMISSALKSPMEALDPSVVWVPKHLSLFNFSMAFKFMQYPKSALISLTTLLIPGLVEVFTCALAAYGLAKFHFKGKKIIFFLVMVTILVPQQIMVAPLYLQYAHFDFAGVLNFVGNTIFHHDIRPRFVDTPLTFLLPSLFGAGLKSGLFIFIYRQFFIGMPKELEEAAYVDGASPFYTFVRIVLPTSGAAIICVLLFSVIWHWNEYDLSTIFMNQNYPLPYMLSRVKSEVIQHASSYSMASVIDITMAGCVLFLTPILLFYLFIQRYFIESIARVGLVG